ncbi:lysophospholipid acyltransferase family protein [Hydrogenophaga defluvii]|uniref:Lysophospholipid acyltransferase family protein n=1 Tax=Hydrogenophaga defluvii TaxID=249410 RepID=A0ABW2S8V1_9BURK
MTEQLAQRRPLWAVYEHVAMVVGLGSLALMCLAWLPFAMLLGPVLPPATGQRLGRQAIMWGFRVYLRVLGAVCGCRFDLSELDSLQHDGPLIIAANHPSLLDVVLIVSRLPNVLCVMKASLMHHPLFGAAARLARYIRNDGMLQIVQQSREALPTGAQVLIFPEGTRTGTFPLGALTPTLGLITQRSGVPVQTVILEYSTPYLGKAWPLWRKPMLPLRCRARLGRRFDAPTDHALFTQTLEAYFRQELTPPAQAIHDD